LSYCPEESGKPQCRAWLSVGPDELLAKKRALPLAGTLLSLWLGLAGWPGVAVRALPGSTPPPEVLTTRCSKGAVSIYFFFSISFVLVSENAYIQRLYMYTSVYLYFLYECT